MPVVEARTVEVVGFGVVLLVEVFVPEVGAFFLFVDAVVTPLYAFGCESRLHLVARPTLRLQLVVPLGAEVHTLRVVTVVGEMNNGDAMSVGGEFRKFQSVCVATDNGAVGVIVSDFFLSVGAVLATCAQHQSEDQCFGARANIIYFSI